MNARCRAGLVSWQRHGRPAIPRIAAADRLLTITVLGEEPRPAYDRVQLSAFFSGKTADDLSLVDADFFETNGIALHLTERAVAIDRERASACAPPAARELEYDMLVLATGSYPFVPPVPGRDARHCHVYRTIEDLEAISASAAPRRASVP